MLSADPPPQLKRPPLGSTKHPPTCVPEACLTHKHLTDFKVQYLAGLAVTLTIPLAVWIAGGIAAAGRALLWLLKLLIAPVPVPLFITMIAAGAAGVILARRLRVRFRTPPVQPVLPPPAPAPLVLSELPELIVKLIALSGKTTLTVPFLVERLKVNQIRFNTAVRELESLGLIRFNPPSFSSMSPPTLSLTPKGQAFVIEKNWDH